jgi:hypothetical protein
MLLLTNLLSMGTTKGYEVILRVFLHIVLITSDSSSENFPFFVQLLILTARDVFILYRRTATRRPKRNKVGNVLLIF